MTRHWNHVLAAGSVWLGLLAVIPAQAASLKQVTRSDWAGSVSLPSYVGMYIYVPDKPATNPPIVVSSHSCGSTATGQMGNIPKVIAAADKNGFILILPDNPGQNCWDVGSKQSLTHDGGGDTQAVAQMVQYVLTKYNGDASRVYAFGGSSGAMMTQALMAVYPDVFKAGSARAGVPAGCWADGYASSNQWSNNCAGGNTTKTATAWGDLVRGMYPSYTGHRPRVQLMQGTADTTISYKNTAESIKEWTNVLALATEPTTKDSFKGAVATYDRQLWSNACGYTVLEAWSAAGGTHSMGYEEDAILKFFGLDVAGGADPEPDCSGAGGAGGAGGGTGGATGAAGGSGSRDAGPVGRDGAADSASGSGGGQGTGGNLGGGGAVGPGGSPGSGGAAGVGGAPGSGGSSAKGGTSGSGGVTATGGTVGTGGSSTRGGSGGSGSGGVSGSGGASIQGGSSGGGGAAATAGDTSSSGCTCAVGQPCERPASSLAALLLLALGLGVARRRRTRP
jgi:acetylxylan esterase